MDSILLFGNIDQKIDGALRKMGYEVHPGSGDLDIIPYIERNFIDLLFLAADGCEDPILILKKLREGISTRKLPVLFFSNEEHLLDELKELPFENIEILAPNAGLGIVVSKVATLLRLRKMAGADRDNNPSLAEVNAHLRDLTEKHTRELEDAKSIQASLLPKDLPKSDLFEIETCYIPLEELGGDWFYTQEIDGGNIRLMIADVTGHGLPAAFIGAMTKMAMVATNKSLPNELLDGMNRLMTPQIPQGRFVTMGAGLYYPASGEVVFCRAGHPPGFVLSRSEGKVTELMAGGLAIGFFEEGDYAMEKCQLQKDDLFVLITDGISEGQSRTLDQYGHKRVSEVLLATSPEDSAKSIMTALINSFLEFTEGRILKDDVTVIVLKRTK